jgi:glycogen debranching enzyme
MANLGEVPFGRYYGSIDSTPLFVLLASKYFLRTGDQATIRALWPHLKAALDWIDRYGDRDGDGFVEYYRESEDGLANQGWKDSYDSIFHEDGRLATGSIALCEVQAYVYAAKKGAAMMGRMLGEHAHADQLDDAAEKLRVKFEAAFWCEELGVYAIALDGEKKPCRAGAGWRHRLARARRAVGRDADDAGNVLGLGRAHRGVGRAPLQSHGLS